MISDVRQLKDLEARFSDVRQGKDLAESARLTWKSVADVSGKVNRNPSTRTGEKFEKGYDLYSVKVATRDWKVLGLKRPKDGWSTSTKS